MEAPRFADQQRKQRDILRDALTKHGRIIIHPEALTKLPGLQSVAQQVVRATPGAHITHGGDVQTGEQWLELTR